MRFGTRWATDQYWLKSEIGTFGGHTHVLYEDRAEWACRWGGGHNRNMAEVRNKFAKELNPFAADLRVHQG